MIRHLRKKLLLALVCCQAGSAIAAETWVFNSSGNDGEIVYPVSIEETFSQQTVSWDEFSGSWVVGSDYLKQSDSGSEGGKRIAEGTDFSDFTLETTLKIIDTSASYGNAGVVFRVTNASDSVDGLFGYYVGLNAQGHLVLGEMNNNWKELQRSNTAINTNQDYQLKVVAHGTEAKIYLDDELKITAQISQHTSGAIGLRTYKASAGYKSLNVENDGQVLLSYQPESIWSSYGGNWALTEDSYEQTAGGGTDYGHKSILAGSRTDNFTFGVDITPLSSARSGANSGVVFRVQNPAEGADALQGYYAGLDNRGLLVLGKMNNNWQQLAQSSINVIENQTYRLKVEGDGPVIKVFLDDQLQLSVTDADWTTGAIGLRTHMATANYDNLSLQGSYTENTAEAVQDTAYLMAYFKGNNLPNEKLFYAKSHDALKWTALNNGNYVFDANNYNVRLRDPFIQRVTHNGEEKFHLVHTKGWDSQGIYHWESDDLQNWTGSYIGVMEGTSAPNAWAPEFFYDEDSELFYVFWTSRTPRQNGEGGSNGESPDGWTEKIWYTTTSDWQTFAPSRVYFYPNFDVIDANILKINDQYQMVYKTEFGDHGDRHTLLATSSSLNPEIDVFTGTDDVLPSVRGVEGPEQFKVNINGTDRYYLYYDFFANGGYWGAASSDDGENWQTLPVADVNFPSGARHGSVIGISWQELNQLGGSGKSQGLVTSLEVSGSGFSFELGGVHSQTPSCGSNSRWYISTANTNGNALLTLLESARNQSTEVTVYGQGRCLYGQSMETPGKVTIE
ncbi:hypothetical protein EOPP23_01520 [Endozoicomonas sp. OPT23]|uniref:family 16 glycoside hydrolase n=1 Tax=Endozoicomonas sp. OPT23 TaxID=2072845 RepID=UPI00129ACC2A|nr:family 16 glycoside hydrolase [Endozoicomonas sp. OPT23]MRI31673.1 hypothetical protein [Endozoicomonas sp. OPT23]